MRKLPLLILLVALSLWAVPLARADAMLTANIRTLAKAPAGSRIDLQIELKNCTAAPTTADGKLLDATTADTRRFPFSKTGTLTLTLYRTDTEISCDGAFTSYYIFTVLSDGKAVWTKSAYLAQASADLATLSAILVSPPSPVTAYARTNGNNTFTGTQDFSMATVLGITTVADWNTLLNKPSTFAPAIHTHPESEVVGLTADIAAKENALTFSGPLVRAVNAISCGLATTSAAGCLSAADWNTFNGKQDALGYIPVPPTRTISTTAPLGGGGNLGGNLTLTCTGCLTSVTAHALLSTTHSDTTAAAPVRGDIIAAIGAMPTWQRLAHSATTGGYWKWNGTDVVASSLAAAGTGACTNQVVTAENADAAPTCATITSAYVDTTIAKTGTDVNTSNQVIATHLPAPLPVNQGGTGTASTLAGIVRGSASAMSATELSGAVITSGSNVTTPGKADALQTSTYCLDAGATDAYACALSPAISSYVTGTRYRFFANTANTGAATINLNSLGAITIKKAAGGVTTDLADNDIRSGQWVDVVFDGTNMQMVSASGNGSSFNPAAPGAIGGTTPNTGSFTNLLVGAGSVTTPAIQLSPTVKTGIYSVSDYQVNVVVDGIKYMTIGVNTFSIHSAGGSTMFTQNSVGGRWDTLSGITMTAGANAGSGVDTSVSRCGAGCTAFGTGAGGSVNGSTQATKYQFGGGTSSFPMITYSGTTNKSRLADDSADAPFTAAAITSSGPVSGTSIQVSGVAQVYNVTTNFTTAANTNLQTITGLSWTLPANTAMNVPFQCHMAYSQGTATAAVSFGIQSATISPTNIFATGAQYTSATAATAGTLATLSTTTATAIVTATPGAISTNYVVDIDGMIENPSNASTNAINIMVKTATSADAVTVLRGSYCKLF